LLKQLGLSTVEDALWFLPWRYEDRSVVRPIRELTPGQLATICGTIVGSSVKRPFRRGLALLDLRLRDASGELHVIFFNQPYLQQQLKVGERVMLSGRPAQKGSARLQLQNPQYEVLGPEGDGLLHVGRIVPIYHETKGLTGRALRVLFNGVLDAYLDQVEEVLPPAICTRQQLIPLRTAFRDAHFPPPGTDLESLNSARTPAHRRLIFEECFLLELALAVRHRAVKGETKGIRFDVTTPLLQALQDHLPFDLTPAQRRVIQEIQRDMGSPHPMNRLLQGDVGCGKTIVALHALLIACGSGYQAAVMVPTEILAEQHARTLARFVKRTTARNLPISLGG
jgi:ATP-dependent DNA helicase RecG